MSARRRMGPPPRMRPVPPVRPGHAGPLRLWERLAFAVVLAIMVASVVVLTISAARAHERQPVSPAGAVQARRPRSPDWAPGHQVQAAQRRGEGRTAQAAGRSRLRASWHRRLAAALAPVLRQQTGRLAVGVTDTATGVTAVYGGRMRFHTASVVKVDILAGLLLEDQRAGTPLSDADEGLAAQMIESSSNDAATDLWAAMGAAGGLAATDATLGLRHTTPGPGTYWGLTTTTASDQLRLLRALTTAGSPLDASSRGYELGLMRDVVTGQNWGVSAAASPGSGWAIKDGWLPDPSLWVVNSMGVVDHDGQRLLLVVLSSGQPTEQAGIVQDEAAARAAAAWVTSAQVRARS